MKTSKHCRCFILLTVLSCSIPLYSQETLPKDYTILVNTTLQESPPQITFNWSNDPNATEYILYRKELNTSGWGPSVSTLAGNSTQYIDTDVETGRTYEYKIQKTTSSLAGYTYILAGIKSSLSEDKKSILLLIDNTYQSALSGEINRLESDLIGEGWSVYKEYISRDLSVVEVKAIIKNIYSADPDLVSVFILGHIAVPYSGDFYPDGHSDHRGAWPADAYYGDMNGTWTDNTVNSTGGADPRNHNVPGDGKFDQSYIPSDIELQIGRVDMANMPYFNSGNEITTTRKYLDKNHSYRHGEYDDIGIKGLIEDNYGDVYGENFASTGWRNFSALVGSDNVYELDYTTTLSSENYLLSFGSGGELCTDHDWAENSYNSIFTILFASRWADWDTYNNFLRCPLASDSYTLTSCWGARPFWAIHPMGMGETIGYCTRITQNNSSSGLYVSGNYARGIHIALMGDPTLRLHVVKPVSNLSLDESNGSIILSWNAPNDDIIGYDIYRSNSIQGTFEKINNQVEESTSYTDSDPLTGINVYMLRAIKLEQSGSGTYYNKSVGIMQSIDLGGSDTQAPSVPTGLAA
ncbi:MAG: fibronectin type III domain-containing protein, partial [Bacteroidales bacterium]|nr:fibronectin type III domain-containing protein [Bacteroidales bacterium]